MSKIKNWLRAEFVNGVTAADRNFMIIGLALQAIAVVVGFLTGTPDNLLSIVSAFTGVVSVVLCAQKKISFYAFGYIQLLTYVFGVAIPNHLYGEIYENIFYFVTMIWGTVIWARRYKIGTNGAAEVKAKCLTKKQSVWVYASTAIGTLILWRVLARTDDPVPFTDAITTIPAFVAQVLMMFGYRDQWSLWLVEDLTSVIMFAIVGNWVMLAQYVFWSINCIYGWNKWSEPSVKYIEANAERA